jgi:5'-methylthioadenosine phosphorylase
VIGMTALPEAKLAREAEICYATLALVTDYDVWHESSEPVTVEMVVQNLLQNIAQAQRVIAGLMANLGEDRRCECGSALQDAIITAKDAMPAGAKSKLAPLIGKYL